MYKSKLITVFKTLNNKEINRFSEYVQSPFFNKNKKVVLLFKLLKQVHPNYQHKSLYRTIAFQRVFGKQNFDEQKLRYVMTDLTKLLEGFLSYQTYAGENGVHQQYFLTKAYATRELEQQFTQTIHVYQQTLRKSTIRDAYYYLGKYMITEEKFLFDYGHSNHIVKKEKRDELLRSLLYYLDVFYISNKLKYACELYNNRKVWDSDLDKPLLLDQILQEFDNTIDIQKTEPTIVIYYKILMTLLKSSEERHYNELIDYLAKNTEVFKEEEMYDIHIFIRNYWSRRLGQKNARKVFDLHKLFLEKKILLRKNYLSQWDYKNIVTICVKVGEFDYAKKFIYKYKKYIKEKDQQNAFSFNLAKLAFAQKDFHTTIRLLHEVELNNPYYHVDTKMLLLKCYYELNDAVPLFYVIDALRAYVRRNKHISQSNKKVYLSFFKFVKKLAKLCAGDKFPTHKIIQQLKQELQTNPNLATSEWLHTKIDEIDKKC